MALGYRYRWTVELFFRWLKCVLGCKQLLTTSENGVALQIYTALIASLLIVLWTGRKPTKRTWEMLQFYFQGWASLDEVEAHLEKQKLIALKNQETERPLEEGLIDCHRRRNTARSAREPAAVFSAARGPNRSRVCVSGRPDAVSESTGFRFRQLGRSPDDSGSRRMRSYDSSRPQQISSRTVLEGGVGGGLSKASAMTCSRIHPPRPPFVRGGVQKTPSL